MLTSEWVKSYATKSILKCMVNHFTTISQKLLKQNPHHIYCHIRRLILQISSHSLNKSFYGIGMQLSAGQLACCMLRAYWHCFRWNISILFVFIVFIMSLLICKFTLRPEWIFNCIGLQSIRINSGHTIWLPCRNIFPQANMHIPHIREARISSCICTHTTE